MAGQEEHIIKRLDQLEKKIYTLVVKCNSLQNQLDTSLEENLRLKEVIKNQKQELNNFQNQEKFNKIVTSIVTGTEGTTGLKKKLDQYIDYLDKSIELLSK